MTDDEITIHRGLNGVYFDRSKVTFIDGRAGKLLYRGYSHRRPRARSRPSRRRRTCCSTASCRPRRQLDAFDAELKAAREIPGRGRRRHPPRQGRAPDGRAAHRDLGAFGLRPGDDRQVDAEATLRKGHPPHLTGADHRDGAPRDSREGREPVAPSKTLSHAANFLYMLTGEEPNDDTSRAHGPGLHPARGARARTPRRSLRGSWQGHRPTCTRRSSLRSERSQVPSHGGAAENVMLMAAGDRRARARRGPTSSNSVKTRQGRSWASATASTAPRTHGPTTSARV